MKLDLDPEELRPLIIEKHGNVTKIAKALKVDSESLRDFIIGTPVLRRALDEVMAMGVDKSISVLFAGLDDEEHYLNSLAAAKVFLKSRAAQRRGFHASNELEVKMPRTGALTLTWLPPENERRNEPPMIEGKVEE